MELGYAVRKPFDKYYSNKKKTGNRNQNEKTCNIQSSNKLSIINNFKQ